jgi:hypothetical protein
MKKLFMVAIVLAALGGALYYFFEMRKTKPAPVSFRENLIGTWKIDSVATSKKDSGNVLGLMIMALDSNYLNYTYKFTTDGSVEKNLGDSLVEKLSYQMKDSAQITFVAGDSTKEEFNNAVVSFDKQQFTLLASDSSLLFFKRQK